MTDQQKLQTINLLVNSSVMTSQYVIKRIKELVKDNAMVIHHEPKVSEDSK